MTREEVSVTGGGTPENQCLATSGAVRLRYEIEDEGGPEDGQSPLIAYYLGDRWISSWVIERAVLESRRLDRAFADPVMLSLEGWEQESGATGGMLYAFTGLEPEPEWLPIGLEFRGPEHRRFPADTCLEIKDMLQSRLHGAEE